MGSRMYYVQVVFFPLLYFGTLILNFFSYFSFFLILWSTKLLELVIAVGGKGGFVDFIMSAEDRSCAPWFEVINVSPTPDDQIDQIPLTITNSQDIQPNSRNAVALFS